MAPRAVHLVERQACVRLRAGGTLRVDVGVEALSEFAGRGARRRTDVFFLLDPGPEG
jgi:hypothetical protein